MATDTTSARVPQRPDAGFTLTELLIVVVLMGIMMATLAMVFSVALRTTPPTQDRVDDAADSRVS